MVGKKGARLLALALGSLMILQMVPFNASGEAEMQAAWPMFGGSSQRTNNATSVVNTAGNGVMWTIGLEGLYNGNGPVIGSDGTIYINCRGGDLNGHLYAIEERGKLKWTHQTLHISDHSPAIGQDGTIHVASWGPRTCQLDALYPNGTLQWRTNFNETVENAGTTDLSLACGPVIASDGTIRIAINFYGIENYSTCLCALDINGTLLWECWLRGPISSYPAVGADMTTYVFSTYNGSLNAISEEGELMWSVPAGGALHGLAPSPAIGPDGTIYIGGGSNAYGGGQVSFYAFNPDSTLRWAQEIVNESGYVGFGVGGSPALSSNGTIYFCMAPGGRFTSEPGVMEISPSRLYALDQNGSLLWNRNIGEYTSWATPLVDNASNIIVSAREVFVFSPSGAKLASYVPTRTTFYSNPVLNADGALILVKRGGSNLEAFEVVASDGVPHDTLEDWVNHNMWWFVPAIIGGIAIAIIGTFLIKRKGRIKRRQEGLIYKR